MSQKSSSLSSAKAGAAKATNIAAITATTARTVLKRLMVQYLLVGGTDVLNSNGTAEQSASPTSATHPGDLVRVYGRRLDEPLGPGLHHGIARRVLELAIHWCARSRKRLGESKHGGSTNACHNHGFRYCSARSYRFG